jgi:hypothetical protein
MGPAGVWPAFPPWHVAPGGIAPRWPVRPTR